MPPTSNADFRLRRTDLVVFSLIVLLHLAVAVFLKNVVGIDITANPGSRPWDWWWQTVPQDLLKNDLGRSLWFLHSQPPLFNLYGALFFNLFPMNPMPAMQYGNIVLGALTSGGLYLILLLMTRTRWISALVAVLLAISLGSFLFEAYMLYDILTCFLITLSVTMLAFFTHTKKIVFAASFILAVSILVLSRSAYHLIILLPAIVVLILASIRDWKKLLIVSALIGILPLAWYVKNDVMYGFFGGSSWGGFNLWKVASATYNSEELEALANQGVISQVAAEQEIFRPASAYVEYGFNQRSNIPVLNQDNQHNYNMIAVAKSYQESALNLIRKDPTRYLRSIVKGYEIYNIPSFQFKHHAVNAGKLWPGMLTLGSYISGSAFSPFHGVYFGSFFFFLVPLCVIAYLALLVFMTIKNRGGLKAALESLPIATWIIVLISYTTLVSILFETGENGRERFYVEQLIFVFLVSTLVWVIQQFTRFGKAAHS